MAKKADPKQSGIKKKQAKIKRITLQDLEGPQRGRNVKGGRFNPDPNDVTFHIK